MHQVLSYETAVRANSSREYREYVTKRTCVSLVLTIAFFTLISGYLLGTFVAERKNHIRQMMAKQFEGSNSSGIASVYAPASGTTLGTVNGGIATSNVENIMLQELRVHRKARQKLLSSARRLSKMLEQDGSSSYLSSSVNTEIFNKYISCTQDVPPNTTLESSEFIERLLDNTAARQRDCTRMIQFVLDANLGNHG